MEAGLTRTLTQEEFEEVRDNVPIKDVTGHMLVLYDSGGMYHRDGDLPACMWNNGSLTWYKHGRKHRDNGLRP